MKIMDYVHQYAEQIGGQYTDYDQSKSVVVVPITSSRFQTVLAITQRSEVSGRDQALFTSKVCEFHNNLDLKVLMEQNARFDYSKFVVEEGYLKIKASCLSSSVSQEQIQEMIQEVAQLKIRQKEILQQKDEIKKQLQDINFINARLEDKINEIDRRNQVLELHWNTLLDLSKNRTISFGTMEESIQCILRVTSRSLQLNRVSIWQYHETPKRIKCLAVYDAVKDSFGMECDLDEQINPRYFKSILSEKVIAVNNVLQHDATAGFVDSYLNPNQIFSMMDAPYFIDGKLAGVLCCESRFEKHTWSCEDMIFATSMADIIALAYRCSMRNEYERNVREMNKQISSQNELLIQKSEEIEKINQSLELRVNKRTEELMVR